MNGHGSERHLRNYHSIQSEGDGNELDENSPILPDSSRHPQQPLPLCDKLFLTLLLLILIVGFSTGLYLITREGRQRRIPEVYNLTSREFWQARRPSATIPRLKLPAEGIVFLQTNGSSCDSRSQCAKVVRKLQLKHMSQKEPDIFYNFLVSGDGSIFEGRGWHFQATFPDFSASTEVTLTVAFLGNFDTNPPTSRQTESAKLFVEVAVTEGRLESCFNVQIWGGNRFFIDMAHSIQETRFNC